MHEPASVSQATVNVFTAVNRLTMPGSTVKALCLIVCAIWFRGRKVKFVMQSDIRQ